MKKFSFVLVVGVELDKEILYLLILHLNLIVIDNWLTPLSFATNYKLSHILFANDILFFFIWLIKFHAPPVKECFKLMKILLTNTSILQNQKIFFPKSIPSSTIYHTCSILGF